MGLPAGLINNYYSISIKNNLILGAGSVDGIINKIDQQIKVTDFITSKSKNTFTDNIYENLYKVEEYINSEQDIENFSKVVKKLIDRDPHLYDALIWDAKLMSYKKLENKEIIDRINSAIELSPANQEAYRFILDYTKKNNDKKLFDLYCEKYHTSLLGGKKNKERSLFGGSSLTRFAIRLGNQIDDVNIVEGINLNEYQDYKINLREPVNITNLQILSNFLPGTSIKIQSFELTNINDEKFIVPLKDVYVSSKGSFFIEDKNDINIFVTNYSDEKIKIKFSKLYKKITQITININFSKANLTNKDKC
tara:strand:+ start:469 stop:1392 length:924 start_codon:yes stop_codon:yes gene_type:complete